MNNQPDSPSADDDIDRRIRRELTRGAFRSVPTSIEPRVLSTITRRRRVHQGSLCGLAMGLLIAAGLSARWYLADESVDTVVASGGPPASGIDFDFGSEALEFQDIDPTALTLPPPVMSFGLLDASQVALLQGLKSFEGGSP